MEINVLFVDDEKEFVDTLAERLAMRMINASVVYNGKEALQFLKENIPDVMVLDLNMPEMSGNEVLHRVRKSHPDVAVIILTGHGSDKDREILEAMGAAGYLTKPVDIDVLLGKIKELN